MLIFILNHLSYKLHYNIFKKKGKSYFFLKSHQPGRGKKGGNLKVQLQLIHI